LGRRVKFHIRPTASDPVRQAVNRNLDHQESRALRRFHKPLLRSAVYTAWPCPRSLSTVSGTIRRGEFRGTLEAGAPERFRYRDLEEPLWNLRAMYFEFRKEWRKLAIERMYCRWAFGVVVGTCISGVFQPQGGQRGHTCGDSVGTSAQLVRCRLRSSSGR